MKARWVQRPKAQSLPNGQGVETSADLILVDDHALEWEVPAGSRIGVPAIAADFLPASRDVFSELWGDALVLHAWHCIQRTRPWPETHRALHAALCASGLPPTLASRFHLAALWAAPRWERLLVANNNLRRADYFTQYRPNRSLIGNNGFEIGGRRRVVALASPHERLTPAERAGQVRHIWQDAMSSEPTSGDPTTRGAYGGAMVGGDGFEPPALSV